jgi:hypothetical protein
MSTTVIASTRFNKTTWEENQTWRRKNGYEGAIYGSSKRMGETIGAEKEVIVLEMHNDEDRIQGIGVVRNKLYLQERCRIYKSDPNYNRYIYRGDFRVDREELNDADEKIIALLDLALFKTSAHSKRGRGISRLPDRIVKTKAFDLPRRIEEIVLRHKVTS